MRTTVPHGGSTAPKPLHPKAQFRGVFCIASGARLLGSRAAVLAALFTFSDARGASCFPSQETLANVTGYSTDTVGRALRDLEHKGIISRAVPSLEERRKHVSTHYQVPVPGGRPVQPRLPAPTAPADQEPAVASPAMPPSAPTIPGPVARTPEQPQHLEAPTAQGNEHVESLAEALVQAAPRLEPETAKPRAVGSAAPSSEPSPAPQPTPAASVESPARAAFFRPRASVPPWKMPRSSPPPQPVEPRGSTAQLGAVLGRLRALVGLLPPAARARAPQRLSRGPEQEPAGVAAVLPDEGSQGPPQG